MTTYTVRVAREGKWWIIRATDFDYAVSQARRLAEVDDVARDLIATMLDVDPDSFDLDVQIEAGEDVRISQIKDTMASSRAELEQAQARYAQRMRDEARRLAAAGLTVRDIGAVLSVSFQRAQQLLEEADPGTRRVH